MSGSQNLKHLFAVFDIYIYYLSGILVGSIFNRIRKPAKTVCPVLLRYNNIPEQGKQKRLYILRKY